MKTRHGFVSNSSSASFVINNKTANTLTMRDFLEENLWMLEKYNKLYVASRPGYTKDQLFADCAQRYQHDDLAPGLNNFVFGDHESDDGIVSVVLHYCLYSSGKSKRFGWRLEESFH